MKNRNVKNYTEIYVKNKHKARLFYKNMKKHKTNNFICYRLLDEIIKRELTKYDEYE